MRREEKALKPKDTRSGGMMNFRSIKNLRRVFYKGRITKFKKTAGFMILAGLAAALIYFGCYAYLEYAVSKADVVLSYPEIAQSKYPNSSRFTYYEFINDDNVNAAIKKMQEKGKYKYFTADDFRRSFFIYSNIEGSANASVMTARSEGNDFSYVANEYKITFVQPHAYKDPNIFAKLFGRDYSDEFLRALIDVNHERIANESGGINGFCDMTDMLETDTYDYNEELRVYRTKINSINNYLDYLNNKDPDFRSESGMTLEDLKGKYEFLIDDVLDGISDYIESSGISKDIDLARNKLKVNIENNQLKYDKYADRSEINKYAMDEYDHTFTENLINVIQNKQYGLYQARPKTEFDTVVEQKHDADKKVAEYGSKVNINRRELAIFDSVEYTQEENKRLTEKCSALMTKFREQYKELSETADKIVTEYYNEENEDYITAKITKKGLISKSLIVNMGIAFSLAAAVAFVVSIFISFVKDSKRLNQSHMRMREIKFGEEEA